MRIKLKGINRITKRLADGSKRTYYYAWKGGPALAGSPGTPEFIASYNRACSGKVSSDGQTFSGLIDAYLNSGKFRKLASRTQQDYRAKLKSVATMFGTFPLAGIADDRFRDDLES